mgnify:CR=1 FL=1
MSVNRITLVITPEQRQAAATAMAQVKSALPALAKLPLDPPPSTDSPAITSAPGSCSASATARLHS